MTANGSQLTLSSWFSSLLNDLSNGARGDVSDATVTAQGETKTLTEWLDNGFVGATADESNTGTVNAASINSAYTVALGQGQGTVGFTVSGLTSSGAVLTVEVSNDSGVPVVFVIVSSRLEVCRRHFNGVNGRIGSQGW